MTKPFNTIGIIGSGTMGIGIAQVVALAGYPIVLYDIRQDILDKALDRLKASIEKGIERKKLPENAWDLFQQRCKTITDLAEIDPSVDLVIEAVPEDLALKKQIFGTLDAVCSPQTCLVSNTSSFSITALAAATKRPEQVAGLHFFNPVPQMKLIEVIQGKSTAAELIDRLCQFSESLGKTPVKAKDTPGFIVNRVARAFYGEALRLLNEGVADVATIDNVMREEGGFAMGPFELMDLIGIDINYAVSLSVYEAYFQEDRFKPHPIQRQMVEAEYLGRKTGRGFYTYDQ